MKISHYFTDLGSIYEAELDDLKSDSLGSDVLQQRLKSIRSQLTDLLPMMETNPEMLAVAFHAGINVTDAKPILRILAKEPSEFPAWDDVAQCVEFEPWAEELVDTVQAADGWEQFLLTTVALEYLHALAGNAVHEPAESESDEDMDEDSDDLNEAGDQWLADQGFESNKPD